jgi:hypothetical protein
MIKYLTREEIENTRGVLNFKLDNQYNKIIPGKIGTWLVPVKISRSNHPGFGTYSLIGWAKDFHIDSRENKLDSIVSVLPGFYSLEELEKRDTKGDLGLIKTLEDTYSFPNLRTDIGMILHSPRSTYYGSLRQRLQQEEFQF